jgi:hypothetical protein
MSYFLSSFYQKDQEKTFFPEAKVRGKFESEMITVQRMSYSMKVKD